VVVFVEVEVMVMVVLVELVEVEVVEVVEVAGIGGGGGGQLSCNPCCSPIISETLRPLSLTQLWGQSALKPLSHAGS
jgi:hypothetical protein